MTFQFPSVPRLLAWLGGLALSGIAAAQPDLPVAPVHNVPETFFGTTVDDLYRNLENAEDPPIAAWMKAHSDHAHDVLEHIPGRAALREELERLDASAAARVAGVTRMPGEHYFYVKREPKDDQFKLYMRQGLHGTEQLLFNPEVLARATGKPHAINYYTPSPDSRWVAVGVSPNGTEDARLRLIDTRTGRQAGPEITRAQFGGVTWTPDSKRFYFVRLQELKPGMPATERYKRSAVVTMTPGNEEGQIRTVLQAGDAVSRQLELTDAEEPTFDVQPDGKVLLYVGDGVSPDFRAYDTTVARLQSGKPDWHKLFGREEGVINLVVKGDRAYVLSYAGAPRVRLLMGRLSDFSMATAKVLLPESQRVLTNLVGTADGIYIEARDGNFKRLLRRKYGDDHPVEEVPLPVLGNVTVGITRTDLPGLIVDLESWTRARQVYAVPAVGKVENTGLQPSGPYDAPTDVETDEVMVKSYDGTMVPMSIMHKVGVKLDGNNPTMLFGYAAYGATEQPSFYTGRLVWLNAGGVWAVANPRGSGVFGEQWHEDGKKAKKHNTWLDTIACAEYLVQHQWSNPSRMGIWGASAGGVLVGRTLTERPDLFSVAIVQVGNLDLVRAETTPNGVPNIPEFGSRSTEEGFRGLLEMSTYHHVKDGVKYPAVLFTHGANDPRVAVWNSTKTAARMMAATSSGKPVLLRLNYAGGHGVGNTKSQILDERADMYAFALWQMGVKAFMPKP